VLSESLSMTVANRSPLAHNHRHRARTLAAPLAAALVCFALLPAHVEARHVRPFFEPNDLELEEPWVLELSLQVGIARGPDAVRVVVPDFEVDLGILPNLELDIDGAYAIEGPNEGRFSFDHSAPDSLWTCLKVGLYDSQSDTENNAIALGVQAGPKLPVAASDHGVGIEAVALLGTTFSRLLLVWNAGGFVEPADDPTPTRPRGIELGVDGTLGLDDQQQFAIISSASYVHFFSTDPQQLLLTAGMSWSPVDSLELSLVGLCGLLEGGDRFGVLVGVSPKLRLFKPPH
jgi:hypothetical protein